MSVIKRRVVIANDPLDAIIPALSGVATTIPSAEAQSSSRQATPPRMATDKSPKVRATFHLSEDLFNQVRDAVVHLSGPPLRLTLAAFAENALRRELERLRREHNSGERFPRREGDLRGGRPIGS